MIAQARFKSARWMLASVLAIAPASVFAQKENASQGVSPESQEQPLAAQAKTEPVHGQNEVAPAKTEEDAKVTTVPGGKALGMSILGNQEAPTSLVIVPWKSSELGSSLGISPMLDDSRLPVDKEVFMRMLNFYEIRSGTALPESAPATKKAVQPAAAANRRKS